MKNYFKIYLFLSLYICFIFSSCLNDTKTEKPTTLPSTQQENTTEVEESKDFLLPEYKPNLSPIQLKSEIESQTKKFENNLASSNPETFVIDQGTADEAEVKIWKNPGQKLLKIERKIKLHKGNDNQTFRYYLYDDNLWYADQVYDKYIFENNKLKYWMDEAFERRIVADDIFLQKEKSILQEIKVLLSSNK